MVVVRRTSSSRPQTFAVENTGFAADKDLDSLPMLRVNAARDRA